MSKIIGNNLNRQEVSANIPPVVGQLGLKTDRLTPTSQSKLFYVKYVLFTDICHRLSNDRRLLEFIESLRYSIGN